MLASSDSQVTEKFYTYPSTNVKQPVMLIVLVTSTAYLDKIVMQLGKEEHVKGIDSKLRDG